MKNFLLGVTCGALGMAYLTGNLKFTEEGFAITTEKSVKPPTVEPYQPPPEPPTAA
jgi:hypothetical protein